MSKHRRLDPAEVRRVCDASQFNFHSTAEVEPLSSGIIGQERAVRAMEFGLRVRHPGYNIYVSGLTGTGRTTYARHAVKEVAALQDTPDEWCYIYNFNDPSQPLALWLPAGQGLVFARAIEELLRDIRAELPRAFASEEYQEQQDAIARRLQRDSAEILNQTEEAARQQGFALKRTSSGVMTVPIQENGEPLGQEEYLALSVAQRRDLEERSRKLQDLVTDAVRRVRAKEKQAQKEIEELKKRVASYAIDPLIQRVRELFSSHQSVQEYLDGYKEDVVRNLSWFREEESSKEGLALPWGFQKREFSRYEVNFFVGQEKGVGAPVVVETNPTYYNLFGSIEYRNLMGTLATDFTMIRPGAIHRANGGYLILQAKDVLSNPLSWEALKRALKNKEARIENIGEYARMVPTTSLKPEPIPLDVKVVMIGTPLVFQLLNQIDEDFGKFFKVRVDFDNEMEYSAENIAAYAAFISAFCIRENLLHFDKEAVARIVEYSSRLVGNRNKLSTRFNDVVELLYEANSWAQTDGSTVVTAQHVDHALEEKVYRSNRYEEKLQELIQQGKILVDVQGAVVGQVNGVAVLDLGDYRFGKPARITARTFMGEKGVINIEREIELSGQIHSKGVLILSGYLGAMYAQGRPLALSASICFEQQYEEVDGDSASSAELYALLSSISDVPIKQGLVVTGSVNQRGEIQPIGGVNEKVEGFFAVCKQRGLTGEQGALIPHQNVDELMLKPEVVEAVRAGLFHIYPVRTIAEGIEILTGVPAGEAGPDGQYPRDSINGKVNARLQEMAEALARFGKDS